MPVRPDYLEEEDFPVPFGRYTLLRLLGEGGMARVFEGELRGPEGFRKRAALKVIRSGIAGNEERLRKGLIKEARLGGLLHHPNVVETYDFGETEGQAWIAMEIVDGLGLDELLDDARPLPAAIAIEMAAQICQGLEHAHELMADGEPTPLVHRDLKPSNVMVARNGLIKVLDFGIAKATHLHGNTTETGMTKGTPAYMSPEQAAGDPVDPRSDLFAAGAIIFELLTGRRFFQGETVYSIMLQVVRVDEIAADPNTFAAAEAAVPGIADILRRCLVRDRDLRWEGARDLERALRGLQGRIPAPGPIRDWLEGREAALAKRTRDLEALSLDDVPGHDEGPHHGAAQLGPTLPLSESVHHRPVPAGPRSGPPPLAAMPPAPSTPPATAILGATRPMEATGQTLQRQSAVRDQPALHRGPWLVALAIFLLLGGAGMWRLLRAPTDVIVAPEAPPPQAEALDEAAALGPGLDPGPLEAPEPEPIPALRAEPTPPPQAEPATAAPDRPTEAPTPKPRAEPAGAKPGRIRHAPPRSAVLGAPNRVAAAIEGSDCTPAVLYGPWSAEDGDLRAQVMSPLGGDSFETELFIPYALEWRRGFRYSIRCGTGDATARWPSSGAHKVDALAR